MPFRVKLKHSGGQVVLDSLSPSSTLSDLLAAVLTHARLSSPSLKAGFPPRALDLSDPSLTLDAAGLRSGDTLIAEQPPAPPPPPPPPAAGLSDHLASLVSSRLLTRQSVPANNSCLFTAVDFCLHGRLDLASGPKLRRLVADTVTADPERYSAALLGLPPTAYVEKILGETWGGGIEVDVLARHFGLEIAVVDAMTTRIDRFAQDCGFEERILLLYDGIHYDPLAAESFDPEQEGRLQTKFPVTDDAVLSMAEELAAEAKSARQFTDTGKFTIKCIECGVCLKGENEAQEHAKSSGHSSFQEV